MIKNKNAIIMRLKSIQITDIHYSESYFKLVGIKSLLPYRYTENYVCVPFRKTAEQILMNISAEIDRILDRIIGYMKG